MNRSNLNQSAVAGRPLNVTFIITSMPVGGAEMLLVNLVRQFDRNRIAPSVACLKQKDILGQELSGEIPVYSQLINHKLDFAVTGRLRDIFRKHNTDAVITVGAGDKMFWGRLAAKRARIPVVLSALHSTGWPDGVGRLNRMLTRITDGFIACADDHGRFLREFENFPAEKVFVIQNGIDTDRFVFDPVLRTQWRNQLDIPQTSPVVGIVAALRSEKNHALFIRTAAMVKREIPDSHFAIAGDGPERAGIKALAKQLGILDRVHFAGSISDIPGFLSALDLFALTSHNEAKPVSILEALSCERAVVATDVGSISESIINAQTGFLVPPDDPERMSNRWITLLNDVQMREQFGKRGRQHVQQNSSLASMTTGYTELIEKIYLSKQRLHIASDHSEMLSRSGSPFTLDN